MRMLILRPGAIGDTLLTFPVIQALREHYAASHVTLVGNAAVLPLARYAGIADEISNYEDARWSRLFLPPSSENHGPDRVLEQSAVAIAWLRDSEGTVEQNLHLAGYDEVHVAPGRPGPGARLHIVEYLAGTAGLPRSSELLSWSLGSSLPSPTPSGSAPCFAIHPGSGGKQKCWPVARFATVIMALWQYAIPVLLLAGPADQLRLQELQQQLAPPPRADLFKQLIDAPLLEVARQLQQCRGYLGNDSGPTHLAAQLGLPTTVLFGPSDPAIWRPLGPLVNVLHEPQLDQLPPDRVLLEIFASLGRA